MLKKGFTKQHLCLVLFLLFNFSTFSQMSIDESNIQDPLKKLLPSFYPELKKPIKSFIYIIDKDTISKSYYSRNGNESIQMDYEKNKPFYKSIYKYNGNLKTETRFFINDMLQSTTTFKYDQNKNLAEWKAIKTVYDKKTSTVTQVHDIHWLIEFDKNKKVKRKISVDASNVKTLSYEYFYDAANRLTEANELQWKDKYEYENGLLTKKYRVFKNDNSIYSSSEFKYNRENLLIESIDKYYLTEYRYDALGLKNIHYINRKDSTQQDIALFYKNNALTRVEINTTDINLKPAFYFKSDFLYFSWNKTGMNKLSLEFSYDQHNNVTEIKYFIKDVYKYSKFFIYEYY